MKLNPDFILELLRNLDIFEDISDSDLVTFGNFFKDRIFVQNEIIFHEGEPGNSMMVIASGEVRVSQTHGPNSEEALMILKKGDIFGEMALLEDLPRSATVIAHSNAITLEISRIDFLNYIEKEPRNGIKILLKLGKTLSSRLRETNAKLKAFVTFSQWL